jgi:hypothetical protein
MTASEHIDARIAELADWRGQTFSGLRAIINAADPTLQEDWKWDTAVWTSNGLVCAVSGFKDKVKLNFFKGAALSDPGKLLNAGFDSKQHRAIDFSQDSTLDEAAITALVREAVAVNQK